MVKLDSINISKEWLEFLKAEFLSKYFSDIKENFIFAKQNNEIIYPFSHLIFNAFNLTNLENIKIVLLGQDPYHNSHSVEFKNIDSYLLPKNIKNDYENFLLPEAMGLSFSVPNILKVPPSLRNIYKELHNSNINFNIPNHGNLMPWGREGMLLLNSILTVKAKTPASHKHFGWENFTNRVIEKLSLNFKNLIFILLGKFAQNKENLIDKSKHFILKAPHPSPLARGFINSGIFKEADNILKSLKVDFKWQI